MNKLTHISKKPGELLPLFCPKQGWRQDFPDTGANYFDYACLISHSFIALNQSYMTLTNLTANLIHTSFQNIK